MGGSRNAFQLEAKVGPNNFDFFRWQEVAGPLNNFLGIRWQDP